MSNNRYHHIGMAEFCSLCGETKRCVAILETPGRIDCHCQECWNDFLGRAHAARREDRAAKSPRQATVTSDEILAMPAGRDLDALVAERVMGLNFDGNMDALWLLDAEGKTNGETVPCFSTDVAAAWQVLERLTVGGGGHSDLHLSFDCGSPPAWEGVWHASLPCSPGIDAATAPLAICREALLSTL